VTGEVLISNAGGGQLLNLANQVTAIADANTAPSLPRIMERAAIAAAFGVPFKALYELDFTLSFGEVEPGAGGAEDYAGVTTGFIVAPELLEVAGGGRPRCKVSSRRRPGCRSRPPRCSP